MPITDGDGARGKRVLVCGSRRLPTKSKKAALQFVWETLVELEPCLVIQGGGYGVDLCAKEWAMNNSIPVMEFRAHWADMGRKAGPVRNRWMALYGQPDFVLAFPGGKGTASMVSIAHELGIPVLQKEWPAEVQG